MSSSLKLEPLEPRRLLAAQFTAPTVVNEGAAYVLHLDAGGSAPDAWLIDWGDGSAVDALPGTAVSAAHAYADGWSEHRVSVWTSTAGVETPVPAAPPARLYDAFGSGGRVITAAGSPDYTSTAYASAVQADGKLLVAGQATGNGGAAIVRYHPDGSLDTSFDNDGYLISILGGRMGRINTLAVQEDGRILAAGIGFQNNHYDAIVARLLPDGALDNSFGAGGVRIIDYAGDNDTAEDLLIEPDGQILLAGSVASLATGVKSGMSVHRLNPDGSTDTGFGENGWAIYQSPLSKSPYDYQGHGFGRSLDIAPGGKILLGGSSLARVGTVTIDQRAAVARFSANGVLDTTFGADGAYRSADGDFTLMDIIVQDDGGVIMANQRGVWRLTSAGQEDGSFPRLDINDPDDALNDLRAMELADDGSVLLAGFGEDLTPPPGASPRDEGFFARMLPGGALDATIGVNGILKIEFGSSNDAFYALTPMGDGRVLLAGTSTPTAFNSIPRFAAAQVQYGALHVGVRNVRPTVTVTPAGQGEAQQPLVVNVSASDPGDDTITAWEIDWGDGSSTTYAGNITSASHIYAEPGKYIITPTVVDEDGRYPWQASTPAATAQIRPASTLAGGTLTLTGAAAGENMKLTTDPSGGLNFDWHGVLFSLPPAGIQRIVIDSLGGNDQLEVAADFPTPVAFLGGAGSDAATFRIAAGHGGVAIGPDSISAGAQQLGFAQIESLKLFGTADADAFDVDMPGAAMAVTLSGGGGDDLFEIRSGPPRTSLFHRPLTIAGEAGNDTLILHAGATTGIAFSGTLVGAAGETDAVRYIGSATADNVKHTGNWLEDGSSGAILSSVESVSLETGDGDDVIELGVGAPNRAFSFDGGAGDDLLDVFAPRWNMELPSYPAVRYFALDGDQLRWGSLGPTHGIWTAAYAEIEQVDLRGAANSDVLDINGTPDAAKVCFAGDTGADTLNLNAGTLHFGADAGAIASSLTIAIDPGASATFAAPQHLAGLIVNGSASVNPGGDNTLVTRNLAIAADGSLDLADNDLVWDYASVSPVGVWTGDAYDGVLGMIAQGRLLSSIAIPGRTRLAAADARDALGLDGTQTGVFSGQPVDSTSVLVKFTYAGDANLDGRVNIDDYGRIDSNVAQSGSVWGWFNGDFNLDGRINIDDYGVIDSVVNAQGGVL